MRSIKMFGLAVMAVLAFSAVAVASASAEEFVASKAGLKFTGKALNTQVFTAKSGGAKVECTALTPEGTNKAEKAVEELVIIKYENCKVAFIGTATISPADYLFLTSSSAMGKTGVTVEAPITITVASPKCKIEVFGSQTFQAAGEIAYSNKTASTIEIKSNVTGIKSKILESESTSLCGTVGEESSTGTYTGNAEAGLEGGTLQIK